VHRLREGLAVARSDGLNIYAHFCISRAEFLSQLESPVTSSFRRWNNGFGRNWTTLGVMERCVRIYIHIYRCMRYIYIYHITIYTYIQVYASYLIAALDGEDNENCGLGARSQHTHTHTHVILKKALQSAMCIKIYIHRNI
jgi:hypothetical protein